MSARWPLIGVDWGTSSLRAFRFGPDGAAAETRRAPSALLDIPAGGFAARLAQVLEGWPSAPVVVSGMAGSRQGWVETPYLPCPADASAAAAALTRVRGLADAPVWIAPGVRAETPDGGLDVMRGEETQVFGARLAGGDGLVIAPGTHSKWIAVEGGRIARFRTFLTGELYALLKQGSTLAAGFEGEAPDPDAFAAGVDRSEGALAAALFGVRTAGLSGRVGARGLAAHLSGVLIGSEARAGLALFGRGPLTLIGEPGLASLYAGALARLGAGAVQMEDGERAAARGLWLLGQAVLAGERT